MTDYRTPENRRVYFEHLYRMNLHNGVMPGLVYLYMPELRQTLTWSEEQALWFAFLNGMTQNPLTSLKLMEQLPECPEPGGIPSFEEWFNTNWSKLLFDTDRLKNKRNTVPAIRSYAKLVAQHGSQQLMLNNKPYTELWDLVSQNYYSFGRLSTFSYLEYVKIMGHGAACTDLMFEDKSGSKSHRNGMLFLMGQDNLVDDKRAQNGFDGKYNDFGKMCTWLTDNANQYLKYYTSKVENRNKDVGYFTFESQLCQFKNSFFGRRYPGVYSDMAYERLLKHEEIWGKDAASQLIWDIRTQLPDWLRNEAKNDRLAISERARIFPKTGFPYRGEHFLG